MSLTCPIDGNSSQYPSPLLPGSPGLSTLPRLYASPSVDEPPQLRTLRNHPTLTRGDGSDSSDTYTTRIRTAGRTHQKTGEGGGVKLLNQQLPPLTNRTGAGLRSAPRSNKATRLLTRPGRTTKSYARDSSPRAVKLQSASWDPPRFRGGPVAGLLGCLAEAYSYPTTNVREGITPFRHGF